MRARLYEDYRAWLDVAARRPGPMADWLAGRRRLRPAKAWALYEDYRAWSAAIERRAKKRELLVRRLDENQFLSGRVVAGLMSLNDAFAPLGLRVELAFERFGRRLSQAWQNHALKQVRQGKVLGDDHRKGVVEIHGHISSVGPASDRFNPPPCSETDCGPPKSVCHLTSVNATSVERDGDRILIAARDARGEQGALIRLCPAHARVLTGQLAKRIGMALVPALGRPAHQPETFQIDARDCRVDRRLLGPAAHLFPDTCFEAKPRQLGEALSDDLQGKSFGVDGREAGLPVDMDYRGGEFAVGGVRRCDFHGCDPFNGGPLALGLDRPAVDVLLGRVKVKDRHAVDAIVSRRPLLGTGFVG